MTSSSQSRWFASNTERQSLEEFGIVVDKYIQPINNTYHKLKEACLPFSTKETLPFHHRYAIKTLMELNALLVESCRFLRKAETLPVVMIALRYQLMDDLSYIKEQSEQLIVYLDNSMYPSAITFQQSIHYQQMIEELFDTILDELEMIPKQMAHIFSEARFQEKRLMNHSRNAFEQEQQLGEECASISDV